MVDSEAKFLTVHRLARGRPRLVPAVIEVSRSQVLKLMNYTRVKLDIQWLPKKQMCVFMCTCSYFFPSVSCKETSPS